MANLHGFREYDQPQQHQQQQDVTLRVLLGDEIKRFPLLGAQITKTNPRKLSYFEMFHYSLFPGYKIVSTTTLIIFIYTLIFVLCIIDGIEKQGQLLEINDQALLNKGALQTNQIKNSFMFQQLITSIFLSRNLFDYVGTIIAILILLSAFEYSSGSLISLLLYIISGSLGALFGSSINCCTDIIYVHSNSAIYGLIGAFFGCVILNWQALEPLKEIRALLCCMIWMLATLVLLFTVSSVQTSHNDKFGQLGGFITGIFLCLAIVPPMQNSTFEQKASIFGWTFLSIFAFITTLMIIVI